MSILKRKPKDNLVVSKSENLCIACGKSGAVFFSKKAGEYCLKCYRKLPQEEKL